MARNDGTGALRAWLRTCPAIDREAAFGVDYLGAQVGSWALCAVPSQCARRENILGEAAPARRQSREYRLDYRGAYGADAAGNLANLDRLRAVAEWMWAKSAAGELPEWEGGRATAVLPALTAAPQNPGSDAARYRMGLRMEFELDAPVGAYGQ